jgi:hypothetical protein
MSRDFTAREVLTLLRSPRWANNELVVEADYAETRIGDRLKPAYRGSGFVILRDGGTVIPFDHLSTAMNVL